MFENYQKCLISIESLFCLTSTLLSYEIWTLNINVAREWDCLRDFQTLWHFVIISSRARTQITGNLFSVHSLLFCLLESLFRRFVSIASHYDWYQEACNTQSNVKVDNIFNGALIKKMNIWSGLLLRKIN